MSCLERVTELFSFWLGIQVYIQEDVCLSNRDNVRGVPKVRVETPPVFKALYTGGSPLILEILLLKDPPPPPPSFS